MSNEELVAEIQAGSSERMGELWEQIRRFVIRQALRVPLEGRADVELDDLIQSGYLALVDAVADYRPEQGLFLTVLGYHLKTAFAEVTRFRSKRQQRETMTGTLSMDAPISDEANASTFGDFLSDPAGVAALEDAEERIFQEQLQKVVAEVLSELPEDRRELLRLRYWEGCTLAEAAAIQGTSAKYIQQKEKKILRLLRRSDQARRLSPFYEFDYYRGTGLGTFRSTGASVQERYLMKQDRIREQRVQKYKEDFAAEVKRIEAEAQERVARMTPEEKRVLLEQYGYV